MWGGGTKKKDGGQGSSKGLELSADGAAAAGSGADVSPSSSSPSAASERQSRAIQFAPHGVASLGGGVDGSDQAVAAAAAAAAAAVVAKPTAATAAEVTTARTASNRRRRVRRSVQSRRALPHGYGRVPHFGARLINDDDYGRGLESELLLPAGRLRPHSRAAPVWNLPVQPESLAVVFILYTAINAHVPRLHDLQHNRLGELRVGVLVDMFFIADLVINIGPAT